MKQLRKTIRKLILENKGKYDAVVNLILSEKLDDIEYALQLAEAAELIGPYTYQEDTHYDSRTHKWMFHEWDEGFMAHFKARMKETNLFGAGKGGIQNLKTWESGAEPNGVSASFRLIEYPPYE
tara:strand:- start:527 stop:898 length:372 start_codon:yes stop_codon:yes gene_type:complete